MVKETNYINIQGWMKTELGLAGNELLTYAIIFGFSQDDESEFSSGVSYISDWLGCSYPTALAVLKKLTDKGLLSKREVITENGRYVNYRVVKNFNNPLLKNLTTPIKNFNTIIKENNKINNNICPQSNSGFGLGTITQNEEQECDNTPIAKQTEDKSKNLFFGKTEDELVKNSIYNWNEIIASQYDFPKIQTITKPRLAKLKARMKQAGGYKEFWTILQESIDDSKFLMYGNDTWKCNFDFVLQESSFVKIMEHQYK